MKEVMGNLDRDTTAKAYRRLLSRIETVVAAKGDFLNRMLDDNHGFHIFFKLLKSDHY
jgi:hypothetical protein